MIETPLAILNLKEIAAAAASDVLPLTCFVLGTNDLVKATRVQPGKDRLPLIAWLSMTVAAARAFGIVVIDGVYNSISDEDGLRAECVQGRALGMDGKTLIHPSQIAPCNAVFSPSPDEVAQARKIVAAFALPENQGKGAISLDGRMVELLHAEIARETIAIAEAIEKTAAIKEGQALISNAGRHHRFWSHLRCARQHSTGFQPVLETCSGFNAVKKLWG